jgi:ribosome-associated heat shock protein Hsp15
MKGGSVDTEDGDGSAARMDKWLWAVRIYKTRGLAAAACREGHVTVAGRAAKPARDVRAGETIEVQQGVVRRTLVVRAVPPSRVGAPRVAEFAEELTPPEEWKKAQEQRVQHLLARAPGTGRPTKRDRRDLDAWLGGPGASSP